MVDYTKALKQGFDAARRAEAARKEIDCVFLDLNTQILQATENRLSIERRQYELDNPAAFSTTVWSTFSPPIIRKVWKIVAFNPAVGKDKEVPIASWEVDRTGYPCKVTWNKEEHLCENREALALCLSELSLEMIKGTKNRKVKVYHRASL